MTDLLIFQMYAGLIYTCPSCLRILFKIQNYLCLELNDKKNPPS